LEPKTTDKLLCAVCGADCDGSEVHLRNIASGRRRILDAAEMPRSPEGRLAVCHDCQRQSIAHRGFLKYLRKLVILQATKNGRGGRPLGTNVCCPYCGSSDRWRISRRAKHYDNWRCRACRNNYSEITHTELNYARMEPDKLSELQERFVSGETPSMAAKAMNISPHTTARWYLVWQSRLGLPDLSLGRGPTTLNPHMTPNRRAYLTCIARSEPWSRGRGSAVEFHCERLGWTIQGADGAVRLTASGVRALDNSDRKTPDRGLCVVDDCGRMVASGGLCSTHYWRLAKHGSLDQPQRKCGTAVKCSKLDETQVRQIRRLAGTLAQRKIAEQFGVSQSAVADILKGVTWKHVA
jgi:transposase-like protein